MCNAQSEYRYSAHIHTLGALEYQIPSYAFLIRIWSSQFSLRPLVVHLPFDTHGCKVIHGNMLPSLGEGFLVSCCWHESHRSMWYRVSSLLIINVIKHFGVNIEVWVHPWTFSATSSMDGTWTSCMIYVYRSRNGALFFSKLEMWSCEHAIDPNESQSVRSRPIGDRSNQKSSLSFKFMTICIARRTSK